MWTTTGDFQQPHQFQIPGSRLNRSVIYTNDALDSMIDSMITELKVFGYTDGSFAISFIASNSQQHNHIEQALDHFKFSAPDFNHASHIYFLPAKDPAIFVSFLQVIKSVQHDLSILHDICVILGINAEQEQLILDTPPYVYIPNVMSATDVITIASMPHRNISLTLALTSSNPLVSGVSDSTIEYSQFDNKQQYAGSHPAFAACIAQLSTPKSTETGTLNLSHQGLSESECAPIVFGVAQTQHGQFLNHTSRPDVVSFTQSDINHGQIGLTQDGSYTPMHDAYSRHRRHSPLTFHTLAAAALSQQEQDKQISMTPAAK